jgi:hypothetical protein
MMTDVKLPPRPSIGHDGATDELVLIVYRLFVSPVLMTLSTTSKYDDVCSNEVADEN